MKKILMLLLLTMGLNAKTVEGTLYFASEEEVDIQLIALKVNGKEKYYGYYGNDLEKIDKRRGEKVRVTVNKKGNITKIMFLKDIKSKRKSNSNLPFLGKKATKDGRTKINISKNGNIKINTSFKNGYKVNYNGKYTKGHIVPQGESHSWKVSKDKVCQGYRNEWHCQKLYKK